MTSAKYEQACRTIHTVLNGVEWDSDTTAQIAFVIEQLGPEYELQGPDAGNDNDAA